MKRPASWSRSAWFRLPRKDRRNERTLLASTIRTLKRFYAPQVRGLKASAIFVDALT